MSVSCEPMDEPLRRGANWAGAKGTRSTTIVDCGATCRVETSALAIRDRKAFEVAHITADSVKTPSRAACPHIVTLATFCHRNSSKDGRNRNLEHSVNVCVDLYYFFFSCLNRVKRGALARFSLPPCTIDRDIYSKEWNEKGVLLAPHFLQAQPTAINL